MVPEIDLEPPPADVAVTERGHAGAGGGELVQVLARQPDAANVVIQKPDFHTLGQFALEN